MPEFGKLYKLAHYRKGGKSAVPDNVEILLKNACFGGKSAFDPHGEVSNPKLPEVHVWVRAIITDFVVFVPWYLYWLPLGKLPRYQLTVELFSQELYGSEVPVRIYECGSKDELRSCILWEKKRVQGGGNFDLFDYTHNLQDFVLEFG